MQDMQYVQTKCRKSGKGRRRRTWAYIRRETPWVSASMAGQEIDDSSRWLQESERLSEHGPVTALKGKSRAIEPGGVTNGGSFWDNPYRNRPGLVLGKVEIKIAMLATGHS
jgi:hypothetical protein